MQSYFHKCLLPKQPFVIPAKATIQYKIATTEGVFNSFDF